MSDISWVSTVGVLRSALVVSVNNAERLHTGLCLASAPVKDHCLREEVWDYIRLLNAIIEVIDEHDSRHRKYVELLSS